MKASKINHKIIIGLFVALVSCLWIPQTAFGQAEKLVNETGMSPFDAQVESYQEFPDPEAGNPSP